MGVPHSKQANVEEQSILQPGAIENDREDAIDGALWQHQEQAGRNRYTENFLLRYNSLVFSVGNLPTPP